MKAAELAKALGGARRAGSTVMARCPAHKDRGPSLAIREAGRYLLVHCHAGCEQRDVITALQKRGLWGDQGRGSRHRRLYRRPQSPPREVEVESSDKADAARKLWRASSPAIGSAVETYLQSRGIRIPPPPSIRCHAALRYQPGIVLPAMIAAVQALDRSIVAVHRTYLRSDGHGKAGVASPRRWLGSFGAGAVRLGYAAETLALAEGVETGLAYCEMFGVPVWAACSASRLASVELPDIVRRVVIAADNDEAGLKGANEAIERFTAQGRKVRLHLPPEGCGDWNDVQRYGAGRAA